MNDLILVEKLAEWQGLKTLVLDSASSRRLRAVVCNKTRIKD